MEKELLSVPNQSGSATPTKDGSKSPGRELNSKNSRRSSIDAKSAPGDSLKSSGKVKPPRPSTPNPYMRLILMQQELQRLQTENQNLKERVKLLESGKSSGDSTPTTPVPSIPLYATPAVFEKERPTRISVLSTPDAFYIRDVINPLNQGADYDYLVIKKHNERPGVFEHKKGKDLPNVSGDFIPAHGLMGIIKIEKKYFLIVVTDAEVVGTIKGSQIYRVEEVEFLPFGTEVKFTKEDGVKPIYQKLKKFCEKGVFYFSYDYPLTLSLQKQQELGDDLKKQPLWQTADKRFFWNRYLMRHFIDNNCNDWINPIIRGCVRLESNYEDIIQRAPSSAMDVIIISRVSCLFTGNRYKARGLNDEGEVAQFAETEQIFTIGDSDLFSYVQVRGSVPVFWDQKYDGPVVLTRNSEATVPAFKKHFDSLIQTYKEVSIIDLLQTKKKEEELLANEYAKQLVLYKGLDKSTVDYAAFDLEGISDKKSKNIPKLISLVEKDIDMMGYFHINTAEQKVISTQSGVFRVNSMDCLDRTNYAQRELAFQILQKQYKKWRETGNPDKPVRLLEHELQSHKVARDWKPFKQLWNVNGDSLEKAYSGIRIKKKKDKGKDKKESTANNMQRVYQAAISYRRKQNTIDIFLGNTTSIGNQDHLDWLQQELNKRAEEFQITTRSKIMIGNWNMNAQMPDKIDIDPWINPGGQVDINTIDIFVFGFQEIVKLNADQILNTDTTNAKMWQEAILNQLNLKRQRKVILLRQEQMVGICVLVFVSKDQAECVKGLQVQRSEVGVGGLAGNKGALGIKFSYNDSSMCFVCAHLSAGQHQVQDRIKNYRTISDQFNKGMSAYSSDYVFWLGDLNFRIDLPRDEVEGKIKEKKWDYLYKFDQLQMAKSSRRIFKDFREGKIEFAPTYKYDIGTTIYDTSEKKRCPAWTDRILYKPPANPAFGCVDLEMYNRCELFVSDHRPVKAVFSVEVRKVDQEKLQFIERELSKGDTRVDELIKTEQADRSPGSPLRKSTHIENNEKGVAQAELAKFHESLQSKRQALENAKADKSSLMSEFSGTLAVMSKFNKYLINNNTSSAQYGIVKEFLDSLQKQIEEFTRLGLQLGDDQVPSNEKFSLVTQQFDAIIASTANVIKKLFAEQL